MSRTPAAAATTRSADAEAPRLVKRGSLLVLAIGGKKHQDGQCSARTTEIRATSSGHAAAIESAFRELDGRFPGSPELALTLAARFGDHLPGLLASFDFWRARVDPAAPDLHVLIYCAQCYGAALRVAHRRARRERWTSDLEARRRRGRLE